MVVGRLHCSHQPDQRKKQARDSSWGSERYSQFGWMGRLEDHYSRFHRPALRASGQIIPLRRETALAVQKKVTQLLRAVQLPHVVGLSVDGIVSEVEYACRRTFSPHLSRPVWLLTGGPSQAAEG